MSNSTEGSFAEALKEALKKHVTIEVDVTPASAFFPGRTVVKVLFDGEIIVETWTY